MGGGELWKNDIFYLNLDASIARAMFYTGGNNFHHRLYPDARVNPSLIDQTAIATSTRN